MCTLDSKSHCYLKLLYKPCLCSCWHLKRKYIYIFDATKTGDDGKKVRVESLTGWSGMMLDSWYIGQKVVFISKINAGNEVNCTQKVTFHSQRLQSFPLSHQLPWLMSLGSRTSSCRSPNVKHYADDFCHYTSWLRCFCCTVLKHGRMPRAWALPKRSSSLVMRRASANSLALSFSWIWHFTRVSSG